LSASQHGIGKAKSFATQFVNGSLICLHSFWRKSWYLQAGLSILHYKDSGVFRNYNRRVLFPISQVNWVSLAPLEW